MEDAYQLAEEAELRVSRGGDASDAVRFPMVPVNEDYLFEVDVRNRRIQPMYWKGTVFEVRRALWFQQGSGSKWIPCPENLGRQIEDGYR